MVGSFSHYGTAEVIDIKTGLPRVESDRLSSCYIAQMPQERYPDFKKEFEATLETLEAGLPANTVKVLLLDGGRPLWGYLEDRKERFAEYEKVLDYFHATEHLSQASEAIFGKKSEEGSRWYRSGMRWNRENGKAVLAIRAITKSDQWEETWNQYHRQCWNKAA